jgi:hypothetical protein
MRILHNWWLGGAAAGAVLAGVFYFGCTAPSPSGWTGAPAEAQRHERLENDREHLKRRREVVNYLVAELVAGRQSLREAATAWRLEDESCPRHLAMHVEYQEGQNEEERYCRSLLDNVRSRLGGDAGGPAVLARLESELTALARGETGPPPQARRGPPVRSAPPVPPAEGAPGLPTRTNLGEAL